MLSARARNFDGTGGSAGDSAFLAREGGGSRGRDGATGRSPSKCVASPSTPYASSFSDRAAERLVVVVEVKLDEREFKRRKAVKLRQRERQQVQVRLRCRDHLERIVRVTPRGSTLLDVVSQRTQEAAALRFFLRSPRPRLPCAAVPANAAELLSPPCGSRLHSVRHDTEVYPLDATKQACWSMSGGRPRHSRRL